VLQRREHVVQSNDPAQLFLGGRDRHTKTVAEILAGGPRFDLGPGEAHVPTSFLGIELLAVERGFVVVRSTPEGFARSIVTREAGPGRMLLPPSSEEAVFGLTEAGLLGITSEARARLLERPGTALALVELLEIALTQQRDALANFAHARHIERAQRKLVQLAETYGRVGRDGIRIDFPLSHALLADMIGSSRETVTRALDELQRTGFVARRGHSYRLLVPPEHLLDVRGRRRSQV
jgi:CRP/FNR family transcriptional regulator, cyclic AMP receptor protein